MLDSFARLAALALAAAFAWAAVAKLFNFSSWRAALRGYGLGAAPAGIVSGGVPLVEALCSVALVAVNARAGAAMSLALLAIFSGALLRARSISGDRLPCGCFGKATVRDYRLMLGRNALLAALAGLVMLGGRNSGALRGVVLDRADDLVPAVLVVGGIAILLWTVAATSSAWRNRES